jgi:hypothetical protein
MALPKERKTVDVRIPIIPMYEMGQNLYDAGDTQFLVSLLGDGGEPGVERFWKEAMADDWARLHPAVGPSVKNKLPVTIHVDGAEVHRNSEYYFFNWGSILSQASGTHSLDARFLLCAIPHVACVPYGSQCRVYLPT